MHHLARIKDPNDIASITEALMEAQADLQTAIGIFRLRADGLEFLDAELIEARMVRSMAQTHQILCDLGRPMWTGSTEDLVEYTK